MSTAVEERGDPGHTPSSSAPATGLQIGSAIYVLLDGRVAWIPINRVAQEHSGTLAGDESLKHEGRIDQAKAAAKNAIDKAADALSGHKRDE